MRLKDVAYSEPIEALNWVNIVHDLYTTSTKVGWVVSCAVLFRARDAAAGLRHTCVLF